MIKLLVLDVDGTLTDGSIVYGSNGMEIKAFSSKDGLMLKNLHLLDISIVLITGRESEAVAHRAADIGAAAFQGVLDKAGALKTILLECGVERENCAYIGDDLNDYSAMMMCGFRACPADAVAEVRAVCDYVSPCSGGHGAVRDICEFMLKREGRYDEYLAIFGVV